MSASEPLIFICRRDSITQPSKVELRKAGVVVVESDEPDQCKLIRAKEIYNENAMFGLVMRALASEAGNDGAGKITTAGRQRETFVKLMAEMLNARNAIDATVNKS